MNLLKAAVLIAMYVTALSARAELPVSTQATTLPFVITSSTFDISTNGINTCKEEYKNIEADAYEFMAGEPMTLALKEQVEKARELEKSLEEASDEEVVVQILKVING
jgi:hypothetical protein